MRTTVTIDDDIYQIARTIARDTRQPVGKVLSKMARRGLEQTSYKKEKSGIPVFEVSEDAPLFGPEDVARGEDEL
ncbi:MAG: hypothetical protein K9L68_15180 [Spirochaetales bacterium]|nr:hypothetical protein [Spirochaetales bacterium]MCF7939935.1 hypothetical protein [Spirochaetales bacterium]